MRCPRRDPRDPLCPLGWAISAAQWTSSFWGLHMGSRVTQPLLCMCARVCVCVCRSLMLLSAWKATKLVVLGPSGWE